MRREESTSVPMSSLISLLPLCRGGAFSADRRWRGTHASPQETSARCSCTLASVSTATPSRARAAAPAACKRTIRRRDARFPQTPNQILVPQPKYCRPMAASAHHLTQDQVPWHSAPVLVASACKHQTGHDCPRVEDRTVTGQCWWAGGTLSRGLQPV